MQSRQVRQRSRRLSAKAASIGAVVTMQKAWKVPILFMGLSLPGTRLSRAERILRLGPNLRRHQSVLPLFFGAG